MSTAGCPSLFLFHLVQVAQGSIRLATLSSFSSLFLFSWSRLRKKVSVWQRSYHSPTNENLPWEKPWGLFYILHFTFHPNTYFVFLPTRLSVTSIFFLCWALLSQIVSSVENILSHNPLWESLGVASRPKYFTTGQASFTEKVHASWIWLLSRRQPWELFGSDIEIRQPFLSALCPEWWYIRWAGEFNHRQFNHHRQKRLPFCEDRSLAFFHRKSHSCTLLGWFLLVNANERDIPGQTADILALWENWQSTTSGKDHCGIASAGNRSSIVTGDAFPLVLTHHSNTGLTAYCPDPPFHRELSKSNPVFKPTFTFLSSSKCQAIIETASLSLLTK